MKIDEIREAIAIAMDMNCHDLWCGVLDDTTPGHYGVDSIEFQIDFTDIWVDIPKKTFSFKEESVKNHVLNR